MKRLIDYINESNNIELISDGNERDFEYVDLGLPSGTMWATCNVGAKSPEDEGLLFQWGRVDGYKYDDENHKFRSSFSQNLKDTGDREIPKTETGTTYNAGETLYLDDDAANVNMGGKWRMPTKADLQELCNNTAHSAETVNGVKGMMFISNINGKCLFIPFSGDWYVDFDNNGSYGNIWSSQVHPHIANRAWVLTTKSNGNIDVIFSNRYSAYSVRGVF